VEEEEDGSGEERSAAGIAYTTLHHDIKCFVDQINFKIERQQEVSVSCLYPI
jgi:hypothetical protein